MASDVKRIVLAYSGGLDTSIILHWLAKTYRCPVIAFVADVGQDEDLRQVAAKAKATGAEDCVVEDLRDEFVRDFVFAALQANAVYEGSYLLGTALARPVIAMRQMAAAKRLGADAVAHGATGKGNDQVRFEITYSAIDPGVRVIAPWREWDLDSRSALVAYAKKNGIPTGTTTEKPYSIDANLFHTSYEGGILEDPWSAPPDDMFLRTVAPEKAPERASEIEVGFEAGVPISLDGRTLGPAGLLAELNDVAGRNGIGRVDLVENRYVGMKSRGVYETPGGTVLHAAHRALESITLDREVMRLRDSLLPKYSDLIYNGFWFSPERELLQRMIGESQRAVTGRVRLRLYKGNCTVRGRQSPNSLYRSDFATFEADKVYRQADAEGFIRLNALRLKIRALLKKR